jgi:sensor domain CHASE-containing protein
MLIIAAVLIGLILLLGAGSGAVMHFSYSALEQESVSNDAGRAVEAMAADIDELGALAYDLGS